MRRKQFEQIIPEHEEKKAGNDDEYFMGAFIHDGILAVDFYKNRSGAWKAMWRTLIDGKDFCNYDHKSRIWNEKKLETMASEHMGINVFRYQILDDYFRIQRDAGKIINGYVMDLKENKGCIYKNIWTTLEYLESKISEERRETAAERKHRRIQEKMTLAPAVPKDFRRFIMEKLFRNDHFMYVSKEDAVCARCGTRTEKKEGMKHNGEGRCPFCRKKIKYKLTGRMKEHEEKKEVLLIQRWDNDVILRYFKCSLFSTYGRVEDLQYSESVRTYHNKEIKYYDKRYICYMDFTGSSYWSDKMDMYHSVSYGVRSCLYAGNLSEIEELLGRNKYLPVEELAETGIMLPWKDILRNYSYIDKGSIFEKLYKAGLKKLAVEYVRTWNIHTDYEQREVKKILMVTGPMFEYMRKHDSGRKVLEVFQDAKTDNCGLNDTEIVELAEAGIKASELKKAAEGRKIIKLLHYLQRAEGYKGLKNTYSHYVDYMDMMKAMDYCMDNDTIRYPRNLKAAHDKAVSEFYEQEKDKKNREALRKYPEIRRRAQELNERYGFEDKDYIITAPKNAADIIEEGRTLHHCVGGELYLRKHNDGSSFILFLRKISDPDHSYYTLEIDPEDNRILQYYGYNDRQPDKKQVDKILDKWKRQLKRKESRIKVAAAG